MGQRHESIVHPLGEDIRVAGRTGDHPTQLEAGAADEHELVPLAARTQELAQGGQHLWDVGHLHLAHGGMVRVRWRESQLHESSNRFFVLIERNGAALRTSNHGACVFVPLLGEGGWR